MQAMIDMERDREILLTIQKLGRHAEAAAYGKAHVGKVLAVDNTDWLQEPSKMGHLLPFDATPPPVPDYCNPDGCDYNKLCPDLVKIQNMVKKIHL